MSPQGSKRNMIVCPICGEISEQPYLNYGAKACYSCRAFFRRAHQKTRHPKFVCKGANPAPDGQGCHITLKTRRSCQKCRYDRCLKAGMKPDYVMTDEQKRNRFKSPPEQQRFPNQFVPDFFDDFHQIQDKISLAWSSSTDSESSLTAENNFQFQPENPKSVILEPYVWNFQEQSDPSLFETFPMTSSVVPSFDSTSVLDSDLAEILGLQFDDVQQQHACLGFGPSESEASPSSTTSTSSLPPPQPEKSVPIDPEPNFEELRSVCLGQQMQRFKTVYLDVSIGEDFLREFVMFAYDVPLSKHFVPQVSDDCR